MTARMLPALLALLLLIALQVLPGGLLLKLNIDNAPEIYFPSSAPAVQFEQELRQRFPLDQVMVAMFEPPDPFADTFIEELEAIVRRMEQHPMVERVLAPMTMDQIRGSDDGFVVEPLLSIEVARDLTPGQRRERMLGDRFAPGLLISEDGGAVALVVRPHALDSSLQRMELEQALLQAIDNSTLAPHLTALSGQIPLDVAQLRSMMRDSMTFIPLTTGIGLLLIGLLFRRWMAVVIAALTIGAVVNATVGLLILSGRPYTLISAILPPLMSALTVALLIHWFNALTHAAARGLQGRARVERALDAVARPALFTALTTAAGLLSLTFSPIQPVMVFGAVAAAGVLILCATVLLLLPPIFARWDRHGWVSAGGIRHFDHVIGVLRHVGMRYPARVLVATALLLALAITQITRIEVETDLFEFFKEDHPITVSTDRIQQRLSGVTTLELVLDADGRDALQDPARLRHLRDLQQWVETLPEVDRTVSMVDLIEEMHWGFHGEDPAYRTLPDSAALISQYLFIYDGIDLHEIVDRDFERTRIVLNLNVHGARAINEVIAAIEARAHSHPPGDLELTVAGFGRLFGDQEALLIEGQVRGLFAALLLIFGLMLVLWRSPSSAALCMVPNVAPVVLIFGLMGLFGIWLDMATAMIASVTVGIAVDDTIHVYHGYRRRILAGLNPVWALARSYQHAGRAVVATTLILGLQFLMLGTSQFVPTIDFGLLTAFGLVAALVFDLLVLPAMLMALAGRAGRRVG